ncbi:NERD domain-containing protein [Brachybacterium paraconglomeratum]|uniref:nuclease-related domain-containing DEAD/DEAH box helicase n=1 Tax=Brachybacterium paraconglomeratum TaxID=173362 RepID=UPI0021A80249|nr:nuclease-related domain-containing DEAD/DEAH box helicase [Brachybacterium paraconglomeratum]MCT1907842.1 NERD domain-containing protein [Brachybacterium paraconglomeratum]
MTRPLPEQPDFASAAEQEVWEHLTEQLPAEAVLIAGQRVTARGEEVEADLLVLWPGVGIAVIEVKGGRISLEDGAWRQADRSGSRELARSPIDQAQRAKHHLLEYLNGASSRPVGRAVHLAVLPYTQLPADWDPPEAPRTLTLDATDLPRLADRIVHALNSQTRDAYAPLDSAQCEHAVKMLRRTHRAIENHQLLAKEIADEGNQLTREQERAIALLRFQHRAQIIGGAGSGKTHLAMIKARTLARDGFRTALLCYSRGLARHFQLLSATWPEHERPDYVGLFHDLPVGWGAETEQEFGGSPVEYYEEHLPARLAQLAGETDENELFDAIVVDEAQDFADAWWEALQPCLRDPAEGVLFVFADEHQSVFDREGRAPITLNPFPLDDNLRSTRTIAHAFAPLTPVEQTPRLPAGAPVRYLASSAEDAVATADDAVEKLMDEGWEPGQIALLTTGSRHPEQRTQIDHEGYDGYWDGFFSATDVFYGHVLGFKGLERPVVVLAVNGFGAAERARQLLYVGLSRARSLLVVVGDGGEIWDAGGPVVWERISGSR